RRAVLSLGSIDDRHFLNRDGFLQRRDFHRHGKRHCLSQRKFTSFSNGRRKPLLGYRDRVWPCRKIERDEATIFIRRQTTGEIRVKILYFYGSARNTCAIDIGDGALN